MEYHEDGTIKSMKPNNPNAKETITKEIVVDMDQYGYIEKPLVPFIKATRTGWCWRSREAVSVDAVSVRRVMCIVR